ncbi:MAG: hypothetical protein KatS3mg105_0443 [Gemmatales bacterium]|nr:MAG: hypothetical protein KatS3mg105_0443 [Gemmatales bacterium]
MLQTGKLLSSAAGLAGTTGEAQSSGRSAKTQKPRWLLFEGLAELRAFFLMYWDRDYRVRHLAWIVPGFALTVMVVSYFTIAYIPFVGAALDKLVDLFLAFFVIKVLQREADRYREHLAARKEQALL